MQNRDSIVSNILNTFDFKEYSVAGCGGWEHGDPENVYTCPIYVEDFKSEHTVKLTLTVVFKEQSHDIDEIYVIDCKGNILF